MSFTSYELVRPWAKAIRAQVVARTMPVWLADPHSGSFKNDRRLSQVEIDTIVNWVANGAPEGDAKRTPPLPTFAEGWQIGKPDVVIDMGRDYEVPATGTGKHPKSAEFWEAERVPRMGMSGHER